MSLASASQPAPGKQNRPRFGLRGSTEAPKANTFENFGFLAPQPVMRATEDGLVEPPMPKAAQVLLLYAFRCFPDPGFMGGEAKRPRMTAFNFLIFLRESGAGEGIRTLDPNLGKVVLYP
jgi:hypothetical protein